MHSAIPAAEAAELCKGALQWPMDAATACLAYQVWSTTILPTFAATAEKLRNKSQPKKVSLYVSTSALYVKQAPARAL